MNDLKNHIATVISQSLIEYSKAAEWTREVVGGVDIVRTTNDGNQQSITASSDHFSIRAMTGDIEYYYDGDSDLFAALAWAWENKIVTPNSLGRFDGPVETLCELIDHITFIQLIRQRARLASEAEVSASVLLIADMGEQQGMEPPSPAFIDVITQLLSDDLMKHRLTVI